MIQAKVSIQEMHLQVSSFVVVKQWSKSLTCSMAASTAASVAFVNGTTSSPVRRRWICTAVVLLLLLLLAAGPGAGAKLGLLLEGLGAAAGNKAALPARADAGAVTLAASVGV